MALFHLGYQHLPKAESFVDFVRMWDFDVTTIIPLGLIFFGYLWGRWKIHSRSRYSVVGIQSTLLFVAGSIVLICAIVSPINVYAGDLFFVHMVQHLLLIMVSAPLFLLSRPFAVFLWAFPRSLRHFLGTTLRPGGIVRRLLQETTVPMMAWLIYVGTLWIWHVPVLYNAALGDEAIHVSEHLSMFMAAILFWWPILGPPPVPAKIPYPVRFLYLFLALFQNIVLGAILTFAGTVVYGHYTDAPRHWGIGVDIDQQLGGILMWIGGSMVYFIVFSILLFAWFEQDQRQLAAWRAIKDKRRRHLIDDREI